MLELLLYDCSSLLVWAILQKYCPLHVHIYFTLEAGGDNTLKGGPIFREVCAAINEAYHNHSMLELPVISAINYGLSGSPFTCGMLLSFFNNHYTRNTPLFVNLDSLIPETLETPNLVSEAVFVYGKTFDFDVSGFMDELLVNGYDYVQGNTYVTYQKNAPLQRMQVRWSNDPILQKPSYCYNPCLICTLEEHSLSRI